MTATDKATELLRLHTGAELLVLVNVWDVASARVVAAQPGCQALATASAAIAASFGYPDGEHIPLDLVLDMTARIVAATDLPVSADLEAGYGDVATTVARAIAAGVAGANLEDQIRPLPEAAAAVQTAVRAAEREGVPLVLNARTDAFLASDNRGPAEVLADAIARGRVFLEAGANCVFVPGRLDGPMISELVDAFGPGKLSVLGVPGSPPLVELAALGVARVSYGPYPQRLALDALADHTAALLSGHGLPDSQI
ncbi:MAG: isocitrate lyase/PEP mutase family protein [Acidimicrobiales bacterium]